jgi:hypothetical protein
MAEQDDKDTELGQAELFADSRDNTLDSVVQHLRLLNELKRGNVPPARPKLETDKGMEQFLFELARLSVSTHQNFLKLSSKHFPDIVEVIRAFNNRPSAAPNIAAKEIELPGVKGKSGSEVTTEQFRIDNPFNAQVHLSFGNPQFRETEDEEGPPFSVGVKFKCGAKPHHPGVSIELDAKKGGAFRVVIPLDRKRFKAGTAYTGSARIFSAGRVVGIIKIPVEVE